MAIPKFAIVSAALAAALPFASSACTGSQKYEFQFQGMWTAERQHVSANTPDYPDTADFSRMALTTHSDKYSMWKVGGIASRGVRAIAETGMPELIGEEVMHNCQTECGAFEMFPCEGGEGGGECTTSVEFEVTQDRPYLSMITMLGPSPDYVAGLSMKDMCGDNGEWMDGFTESLMPLDAGTDSGTAFVGKPDILTDPVEQIATLSGSSSPFYNDVLNEVPAVAEVTVTKVNSGAPPASG